MNENKHEPQTAHLPPHPFFSPAPREPDPGGDREDHALAGNGRLISGFNTFVHTFGVRHSSDQN